MSADGISSKLEGERDGEHAEIQNRDAHAAAVYRRTVLGITRSVLNQLRVTPKMVNRSAAALAMIQVHEFDVIIVDWREIDNLAEFLSAVRHSKLNQNLRASSDCARPTGSEAGVRARSAPIDSQTSVGRPD